MKGKLSTELKAKSIALFPGAFNPLHDGHRRMHEHAEAFLQQQVCYEISIENVDKPPLDAAEIEWRLAQFGNVPCWITRAPTFLEKARIFAPAVFVVGADTVRRISSPKYYGGNSGQLQNAIAEIRSLGCRFLVFGREIEGTFHELPKMEIVDAMREICDCVPESLFRHDISSSQLRENQ